VLAGLSIFSVIQTIQAQQQTIKAERQSLMSQTQISQAQILSNNRLDEARVNNNEQWLAYWRSKTQHWIADLKAGKNPFTPDEMKSLLNE
jgi:hypothetical protein